MGWTNITDPNIQEVIGDEGWDAAGRFMDEMIEIYTRTFNRVPTWEEVKETVRFTYLPFVEHENEEKPPYP